VPSDPKDPYSYGVNMFQCSLFYEAKIKRKEEAESAQTSRKTYMRVEKQIQRNQVQKQK